MRKYRFTPKDDITVNELKIIIIDIYFGGLQDIGDNIFDWAKEHIGNIPDNIYRHFSIIDDCYNQSNDGNNNGKTQQNNSEFIK